MFLRTKHHRIVLIVLIVLVLLNAVSELSLEFVEFRVSVSSGHGGRWRVTRLTTQEKLW